jgi:predicted ferric reductase
MSEQLWWYVARSGGIVALVLTGLSVIWGLLYSTKLLKGRPGPKWTLDLHRFLGGASVVFTGIHVAALMLDSYVHFGWTDVLIPFASDWKPGAVAWGIVTAYLLVAVQGTSLLMKRIPRKWWKGIHLSSYALFWTGLVHGITAGTDSAHPLYIGSSALAVIAVLGLTVYRILTQRKLKSRPVIPTPTPLVESSPPTLADVGAGTS